MRRDAGVLGGLGAAPGGGGVAKWLAAVAGLMLVLGYLVANLASIVGGSVVVWVSMVLTGTLALGLGVGGLRMRRLIGIHHRSNEAIAMLNAGRVDEARTQLEQLEQRAKGLGDTEALCRFNVAAARMRGGELHVASEIFEALLEAGWFERRALLSVRPNAIGAAAFAAALRGHLDRAEHWIERGQRDVPESMRGFLLPAEVTAALRRGEIAEALRLLDTQWTAAEAVLPASSMRGLSLLRAFAAAHEPTSDYRDSPAPTFDGHLDRVRHLWVAWPELQAFVESQRRA